MRLRWSLFFLICLSLVSSVISAQNMFDDVTIRTAVDVQCGSIIQEEFTTNFEAHIYRVSLAAGDDIRAVLIPAHAELRTRMEFYSPTRVLIAELPEINNDNGTRITSNQPGIDSGALAEGGNYQIQVFNFAYDTWTQSLQDSGGTGAYALYVGCIFRDGTVIDPVADFASLVPSSATPEFSGFGFPGIPPVDFLGSNEVMLEVGTEFIAPVTWNQVGLFTYFASAGESRTMTLAVVSGDISIGAVVINEITKELVFAGVLPSSDNLSVELTFPNNGTYAIGVFHFNTSVSTEFAGAVSLILE